jgi:dienelactone hydrolase
MGHAVGGTHSAMKKLIAASALAFAAAQAQATIVTQDINYNHAGTQLRGFLAYDDTKTPGGKLPGVLIVHEWWGLNDYTKGRAVQLAKLGYVAFALDMYGAGIVTTDKAKAGELAGQFYHKPLMAERAQAGLDQLLRTGLADPSRVAAIGYCFGGSTVQALAYSGAPLAGIVSFHGGLIPATAETAAKTKAKILICHGALDPSEKPEEISAYIKSMNDSKLDYEFIEYAGALHAFTNPDADKMAALNGLQGFIGYSPSADHRSWADMNVFFAEIFAPAKG